MFPVFVPGPPTFCNNIAGHETMEGHLAASGTVPRVLKQQSRVSCGADLSGQAYGMVASSDRLRELL
jgi:hypothetical protein